ncbi:hypothetical protein [Blastococcus sp. SYSU DS0539]
MPDNIRASAAGPHGKAKAAPGLTAAEQSRRDLTEARSAEAAAIAFQAQYGDDLKALEARACQAGLEELDDLVPEHLRLSSAVTVTGWIVEGCQLRVKRAQANLINDDVRLANVLADVLAELFGGKVPVRAVTIPADVQPNNNGEPVLCLLQKEAGKDRGGVLSGELTVTYFRDSLMSSLDPDRLDRACQDRGFHVEVIDRGTTNTGDVHRDTVLLKVRKAFPSVPVLSRTPTDNDVRQLALDVRDRLAASVRYRGERSGIRLHGDPVPLGTASEVLRSDIIARRPDGEGGERMTVAVAFAVRPARDFRGNVSAILRAEIERCKGLVAPGTGRIVSVDNIETSWSEPNQPPVGVVVEGYDTRTAWKVSADVTLHYRIA